MKKLFTTIFSLAFLMLGTMNAQHSVAREWNEQLLQAIRTDFARPTVHARNLFHISAAMYDAWAAYDTIAEPFLLGKTVGNFTCPFNGMATPADIEAARKEAISFAAYRLMKHRFQTSPGMANLFTQMDFLMAQLGYDTDIVTTDYSTGSPAALGNYIAQYYKNFGLQDGAQEQFGYTNQYYSPVNASLIMDLPGNPNIADFNRWQPLTLDVFIDQGGNPIPINTPPFLSPEWGNVTPFSLTADDLTVHQRAGHDWKVYHDPGEPPYLSLTTVGGVSEEYKWNFELVSVWSSHLNSQDTTMWDISPASIGNVQSYPTTLAGYHDFYDLENGGDASVGHSVNPKTGMPYAPQMVKRGDYARVLAEFWADGPHSETPPGHWFTILNYVNDQPEVVKKFRGQGPLLGDLEWDVKSYLALGGAMHDVAITAWGIKGYYDYIRPVSAIRAMAELGQSSDPGLPSYHAGGMILIPGYVELVQMGDPLAGVGNANVGKIKLKAWKGPNFITNPATQEAGVDWILAANWWPYQRPSFVTPPFAGYVSGHSTYSRAAAELLTALTNDPFFPGGMGVFECPKNEFLVFEEGPSDSLRLQWATYRDASDQCSLSRIWGGIHPPADDIPGRFIGMEIGPEAFEYAENLFYKDDDGDGYFNYVDCDDNDQNINPGVAEVCDGLDNDCNGMADDGLTITTYYVDNDQDGFGDANLPLDTCLTVAPTGFATLGTDCNDNDVAIGPNAIEVCDEIDNNCNNDVDEGLPINVYYQDNDNDGFGSANASISSCDATPPTGYASLGTDCNDNDVAIGPNAVEVCDEIDNNCNNDVDEGLPINVYYQDNDNDGFGTGTASISSCEPTAPTGYVLNFFDCDDTNAAININAVEVCDGVDNNCNNAIDDGLPTFDFYVDADNDGYGDAAASLTTCETSAPQGYADNNLDCNDANANINPDAAEIEDDIDNDCNGLVDDGVAVSNVTQQEWKVFPNPTHNSLTVFYEFSGTLTAELFRADGTKVFGEQLLFNQSNVVLDLRELPQGVYLAVFSDELGRQHFMTKVVKM